MYCQHSELGLLIRVDRFLSMLQVAISFLSAPLGFPVVRHYLTVYLLTQSLTESAVHIIIFEEIKSLITDRMFSTVFNNRYLKQE